MLSAATATGVTYDSLNATVGEAITIKGSNGIDVLTGGSVTHDTIDAGAGADTVVYDGGNDVFTLGAGADTVDANALGTSTVHLTIADLAVGDKIDVAGIDNSTADATVGAATTLGSGATFAQYLDAAAAYNSGATTASVLEWFQFDGDTYLVVDNSDATTFAATDGVIEITGLIDLSTSTIASEILTVVAV